MHIYIPTEKKYSNCLRNLLPSYSYFGRLAFHMPGSYFFTIFNYFIVVPASGELPFN